jgi:hypothetical protein
MQQIRPYVLHNSSTAHHLKHSSYTDKIDWFLSLRSNKETRQHSCINALKTLEKVGGIRRALQRGATKSHVTHSQRWPWSGHVRLGGESGAAAGLGGWRRHRNIFFWWARARAGGWFGGWRAWSCDGKRIWRLGTQQRWIKLRLAAWIHFGHIGLKALTCPSSVAIPHTSAPPVCLRHPLLCEELALLRFVTSSRCSAAWWARAPSSPSLLLLPPHLVVSRHPLLYILIRAHPSCAAQR